MKIKVNFTLKSSLAFGATATWLLLQCGVGGAQPQHLYVTLPSEDACRCITLNVHIKADPKAGAARLDIPEIASTPLEVQPDQAQFGRHRFKSYRFLMKDLTPNHSYEGQLSVTGQSWKKKVRFHTPPAQENLRIVMSGDSFPSQKMINLLAQAKSYRPHLFVFGGDLAYDNGEAAQFGLWESWLSVVEAAADGPMGMVPILAVIGNHEVQGGFLESTGALQWSRAPHYDYFFHRGQTEVPNRTTGDQPSYGMRRFGQQLGLWFLDSGHLAHPGGRQSPWLQASLKRSDLPQLRIAAYHVPLYPSVRDFREGTIEVCRQAWSPIFDQAGFAAVFEHHDHALKRTVPIRNQSRAIQGTVHLGDGCLGADPRPVDRHRWYLAKAASLNHYWLIETELKRCRIRCQAIGQGGQLLDEWSSP